MRICLCLRKEGTEINLETLSEHLAAARPSYSVTVLGMPVLSKRQNDSVQTALAKLL